MICPEELARFGLVFGCESDLAKFYNVEAVGKGKMRKEQMKCTVTICSLLMSCQRYAEKKKKYYTRDHQ